MNFSLIARKKKEKLIFWYFVNLSYKQEAFFPAADLQPWNVFYYEFNFTEFFYLFVNEQFL